MPPRQSKITLMSEIIILTRLTVVTYRDALVRLARLFCLAAFSKTTALLFSLPVFFGLFLTCLFQL